jgi:hypothetical protein
VLADSLTEHHPGERLHVLVTDDRDRAVDPAAEPFELCRPGELPLSRLERERMEAIYDAKELVTSIKFWQIRALLATDDVVLFLDSDIEIFAPLTELGSLCAEHGVVVTPHCVEPIPLDGKTPTELQIQRSGIYNTGFIGVGSGCDGFLDWISERARRHFALEPAAGLWFDQRWFDYVPLFFGAHVSRDRTYNVAYWNLHERELEDTGGDFVVDGRRLAFFHFSGFDPHRPELLTRVASRVRPPPGSPLQRLCADYARKLLARGYDECIDLPYGLERTGGVRWTDERRRLYRAALVAGERGDGPMPPEPREDALPRWLRRATRGARLARLRQRLVNRLTKDRSDVSPRTS